MADHIDTAGILSTVDIVNIVSRYCELTKKGNEFVTRCVDHSPDNNPSMYVSPTKGFVHCFSCGLHLDAIGFLMHMEHCDFQTACKRLTNGGTSTLPPVIVQPQQALKKAPPRVTFPAPNDTPPDMKLRKLGEPSQVWTYRTAEGGLWGFVARYETEGAKEFRCFSFGQYSDAEPAGWLCKHWTAPRPIYGLDRLAERPQAQVLICEGEKTADAGTRLFPGMVSVCWSGGANAWTHTDWSPLKGRKVVLVPDNDQPGREAMLKLSVLLAKTGCIEIKGINTESCGDIASPTANPPSWDLADFSAETTPEQALAWAKPRVFVYPVTQDAEAEKAAHEDFPPLDAYNASDTERTHRGAPEPRKPPRAGNGSAGASAHDFHSLQNDPLEPVTAASVGVVSIRASQVKIRPVNWLWKGKLACGKISLIQGDPGLGKSMLTASLAAVVTTGGMWPVTRDRAPLGSAVILSAEDDPEDTLVPRLEAAGADLDKVEILQAIKTVNDAGETFTRGFDLSQDVNRLIITMHGLKDCRLVVIDPVLAYVGQTKDSHKTSDVRGLLEPLKRAAYDAGASILLVNHLNKSSGQSAINRGQGSNAWTAASRYVGGIIADKETPGKRYFCTVKNNLGADGSETNLSYSIESYQLPESDPVIVTARILWDGQAVTQSTKELFAQNDIQDYEKSDRQDAAEYLTSVLASGPIKVSDLQVMSRKAGHHWPTVKKAKEAARIVSRRSGFGKDSYVEWSLPDAPARGYSSRED